MPYKEKEIKKLYYSIGEVAEMYNVNPSLIRFWEKEFNIFKPHKNQKGNRLFTPEDIENFKKIYHLVKEKGYTLQGAKDYLKAEKKNPEKTNDIINSLQKIKKSLLDIKKNLPPE